MFKIIPLYFIKQNNNLLILKINIKNLLFVIQCLKMFQFYRFKLLICISCVDFPEKLKRFELNYHLQSIDFNRNIILRCDTSEIEQVNTVSLIYKSAVWLEREIWDMFGIYFKGHFDLRRILTDYGYPYHPLRKSFPLQGYSSIYYDYVKKKVLYKDNKYFQKKKRKRFFE